MALAPISIFCPLVPYRLFTKPVIIPLCASETRAGLCVDYNSLLLALSLEGFALSPEGLALSPGGFTRSSEGLPPYRRPRAPKGRVFSSHS